MYNTMVKLRNKKAFTLVEMMAVIAIVAVLVAVVVPIIGKSTTKARAATNAANLRSVESELATMKVSNPECFVSAISESPGKYFAYVLDFLVGDGAGQYYLSKIEANDAGELIFKEEASGESVTLYNVPTSVAVSADTGMDVADGTKMVVYISGNDIFAAYLGTDGTVFDKDCFAEVAETGKFTGETGSPQGGAIDKLNCLMGNHKWNNGVCSVCGKVCDHTRLLGGSAWSNGVCSVCGITCPDCNGEGTEDENGCSKCGKKKHVHEWVEGTLFGFETGTHVCSVDGCDAKHDASWSNTKTESVCRTCTYEGCGIKDTEHDWGVIYSNKCSDCGYIKAHTCKDEIGGGPTTNWKNGLCDTCGEHVHDWKDGRCNFDQGCVCPRDAEHGAAKCDECGYTHTCIDTVKKCTCYICGRSMHSWTKLTEEKGRYTTTYYHQCAKCNQKEEHEGYALDGTCDTCKAMCGKNKLGTWSYKDWYFPSN